MLAGGGVHASQATPALSELSETSALPVFTTNMGKGAVEESGLLAAGPLGPLTGPGSLGRHTRGLLREADLVVLVGTRTNEDGTDKWRLIDPDTQVVHIDIDPQEVGRNYEAIRLVGDARATMQALTTALRARSLDKRSAARGELERRIAQAWADFDADRRQGSHSAATPIRPERILAAVQRVLDADTIVAADASYSSNWVVGQLRCEHPEGRFLTPRGLAGLGWGVPLALGAKLARPTSKVIAVVGDGGFAHAWAELETAVRHDVPITIIGGPGLPEGRRTRQIRSLHQLRASWARRPRRHRPRCGARGHTIQDPNELDAAVDAAAGSTTLTLLDIDTDPQAHPPISLYDGTLDHDPAHQQGVA